MPQIYKIYMNQSILLIGDFEGSSYDGAQYVDIQDFHFENLFNIAASLPGLNTYLLQTLQPAEVLREILGSVKVLRAAGGMVENPDLEFLFIYRLGKWDLPKGKAEQGESPQETALREVAEECGISVQLHPDHPQAITTYHAYRLKGKLIIKPTDWFFMQTTHTQALVPQLEEGITQVRWIAPKDWALVRENTYPLIEALLHTMYEHANP